MNARPAVPPPERRFAPRPKQPLRDIDAGDRAIRLRAAFWGIVIVVAGIPISLLLAKKMGVGPPLNLLFLLGAPLAGYLVYRASLAITFGSAAAAAQIHNPSGASTPAVREYSRPQALVAGGHYRDAIEAYEDLVAVYPEDPEPYVRIARILRDHLENYDEAIRWFKRARAESTIDVGRDLLVSEEIIEIYRYRLDQPARAIPELARLIDRYPDHPSTDAARRQLRELREQHLERSE